MSKKVIVIISLLLAIAASRPVAAEEPVVLYSVPPQEIVSCDDPSARTRCNDGMCSTSTGQGTCSSHGGVAGPVERSGEESSPSVPVVPTATATVAAPIPAEPPAGEAEPAPGTIPESGAVLPGRSGWVVAVLSLSMIVVLVGRSLYEEMKE